MISILTSSVHGIKRCVAILGLLIGLSIIPCRAEAAAGLAVTAGAVEVLKGPVGWVGAAIANGAMRLFTGYGVGHMAGREIGEFATAAAPGVLKLGGATLAIVGLYQVVRLGLPKAMGYTPDGVDLNVAREKSRVEAQQKLAQQQQLMLIQQLKQKKAAEEAAKKAKQYQENRTLTEGKSNVISL